jgi:hypothetical protein
MNLKTGSSARLILLLAGLVWAAPRAAPAGQSVVLENERLSLRLDRATGALVGIDNKLTGETYPVRDDRFAIEAVEFRFDSAGARLASLARDSHALTARYEGPELTVEVKYRLPPGRHFAEKQLSLTSPRPYGLKRVVLGRPALAGADLRIVAYRYPKFGRKPGEEPTATFFGRTSKGGFFTGVEVPFDASSLLGRQITLCYAPSLKVAAGEPLVCEPVYFGVYRRGSRDGNLDASPRGGPAAAPGLAAGAADLPLPAESEAMVAMTSDILGPFRFGLVPMACGWHSEMEHGTYTPQSAAADCQSLDFLAECGIDWVSDSHPWGGETAKMNALGPADTYRPGPLVEMFLQHARKVGVKVVMWSSMNNTHAWGGGRPFRADRPQWRMTPLAEANCIACRPFLRWLLGVNLDGMAAGGYRSWVMDGDFFGGGGWYTTVVPVHCPSDRHDHLPGDSNYACQQALSRLVAGVRERFPDTYIFMCRPPMDLGVWSLRNVDACFTLLESGTGKNLAAGDQIRTWSRVRVHRDFFPHYLDQPLLFPSREGGPGTARDWPSGNLDYILLSALSSSPNQLYYLPTKSGIPAKDKAEIRKWLDWGRRNAAYLKVRRDLPGWPAPDKVDGSAHFVGDRGLVFLFNSSRRQLPAEFALSPEDVGLRKKGAFRVAQEYPPSGRRLAAASGAPVQWTVPAETAVVLRIEPAGPGEEPPRAPAAQAGPQSGATPALVGTWKLVSIEEYGPDGRRVTPLDYGPEPIGLLIYDATGHMSVHAMRRGRPRLPSDDVVLAPAELAKAAFAGYGAYFGTYEVRPREGLVIHHVQGSLLPNWEGKDQPRRFTLSGDKLTLEPPPFPAAGQKRTRRLTWQRVGP